MSLQILDIHDDNTYDPNRLRRELRTAREFDECIRVGGKWLQDHFGIADGVICIHIGRLTNLTFPEYAQETESPWCTVRFPVASYGHKDLSRKKKEENLLSLMGKEIFQEDQAKQIMRSTTGQPDSLARVWVIKQDRQVVGAVWLYFDEKSYSLIPDNEEHKISVFFRRACEELNSMILRQLVEVREFERKAPQIENYQDLFKEALSKCIKITEAESGALMEINHLTGGLKFVHVSETWTEWYPEIMDEPLAVADSIAGSVALTKKPRIVGNLTKEKDYFPHPKIDPYISGMLEVPVIYQGVTLGVIGLDHSKPDRFFQPDLVAVELLAGILAPLWRYFQRIESDRRTEPAFRKVFGAQAEWDLLIKKFTVNADLKFACLQLVHTEGGFLQSVAATDTVYNALVKASRVLLTEPSVCRKLENIENQPCAEISTGQDPLLDRWVVEGLGLEDLLWLWFPLMVERTLDGEVRPLRLVSVGFSKLQKLPDGSSIKVFPLDYEFKPEGEIVCVGVIAAGCGDGREGPGGFPNNRLSTVLKAGNNLVEVLIHTLPDVALGALSKELLNSSGAGAINIMLGTRRGKREFALSASALSKTSNFSPTSNKCIRESLWQVINQHFGWPAGIGLSGSDWTPHTEENESDLKEKSEKLAQAGVKSYSVYPLVGGAMVVSFNQSGGPNHYQHSILNQGARDSRRLIRYLVRDMRIDSRERLISSFNTLGRWLESSKAVGVQNYQDAVCKILIRMMPAKAVNYYEYDLESKKFEKVAGHKLPDVNKKDLERNEQADLITMNPYISGAIKSIGLEPSVGAGWIARLVIPSGRSSKRRLGSNIPFTILYLHFGRAALEREPILDLLKTICGPTIRRQVQAWYTALRLNSEMTVLRNLASVNPAEGPTKVFRQAKQGLKSLLGYRGCGIFFLDEKNKQLVMEYSDNSSGMLTTNRPLPMRIPLNKLKYTEPIVKICNEKKEIMALVGALSGSELKQQNIDLFPFRSGAELILVRTWPREEERNESVDLHMIVIARDDHNRLTEVEARFIGNMAVHIHMSMKQAREWVKIDLGRRLDRCFAVTNKLSEFSGESLKYLSAAVPGAMFIIYVKSEENKFQEQPVLKRLSFFKRSDYEGLGIEPPKELNLKNNNKLFNAVVNGEPLLILPSQSKKEIGDWNKVVGDEVTGAIVIPCLDIISKTTLGCIICLCTLAVNANNPGYVPFNIETVNEAAEKIAAVIVQKNREARLTLDAARLGHLTKAPVHGIFGFVEKAQNALQIGDKVDLEKALDGVNQLASDIDRMVMSYLGATDTESETNVYLGHLIDSLVLRLSPLAEMHGVKIVKTSSFSIVPEITINSLKVEIVLVALLDNAIKYSDPEKEVRISIHKTSSGYQLLVSNRGQGIREQEKEKIYEMGFRSPARPKKFISGSGVGLAMAKKTCEELGIKISHISRYKGWGNEAQGRNYFTEFCLDFPSKMFR